MLDLEDAFSRVLPAPHRFFQRIPCLGQFAIEFLQSLQRSQGSIPVLIPHGKFGHQHQRKRIACTLFRHFASPQFEFRMSVIIWQDILLEIPVKFVAYSIGLRSWKFPDLFKGFVGLHHTGIERDSVEDIGQEIIVESTENSCLTGHHGLAVLVYPAATYHFYAFVAIHHSLIPVLPDLESELRLGGRYGKGKVRLSRGRGCKEVVAGFRYRQKLVLIDALERAVAGIHGCTAFRFCPEEIFPRDKMNRVLVK